MEERQTLSRGDVEGSQEMSTWALLSCLILITCQGPVSGFQPCEVQNLKMVADPQRAGEDGEFLSSSLRATHGEGQRCYSDLLSGMAVGFSI